MTVNRADGTAYGDLPASRLVRLFWYTIHAYPPGHVAAYRTLTLDPIVSSGYMDPGSMSGAVHV